MRRLFEALNGEARLNDAGRAYFAERIGNVLVTRLRVEDWFRRHPEILEEEIAAPLAIVGLPRTGTTMMHRTIASDHRMYAPLWYEVRNPAPLPGTDFSAGIDPRIAVAEAEVRALLETSPDLASIHPMDARGPDEDIMLLEQSFFSTVPESFAHLPQFGLWLEQQDQRPGYRYLKRLLQFLQWQKKQRGLEAERWVLKAPHHIHFPAVLFETFPDVKVLQTHRDPLQLMPSYGSMMYALIHPLSDAADKVAIARHWCDKWATGMTATLRFRDAGHDDRYLDMWYEDTVSRPLEEIQRLYDFVGVDLTPEARAEMERWRDMNRREARPTHQYTLEEYGFTEEGLKNTFREYRERYILSRRPG
ncbi:MAG: sulfotransferase [Gammaproteobacteria bacterium]|nr:sulfotransferase [Gammaproteobacteria bacterium]MBK9466382.1 sulfotransferase [Gammaproteobacteria bacterium]